MPHYLVKDRLKGFKNAGNQSYRVVVRRIGAVIFFRDRLNMSKLPARRIGRSRETQTKASSEVQILRTTGGTPSGP